MKKSSKRKAFTLAEFSVVLLIISIIAIIITKATKATYTKQINNLLSYSAFYNLKSAVAELAYTGCSAADLTATYCTASGSPGVLPYKDYYASLTRSLCYRLVDEELNVAKFTDPAFCGSIATITNGILSSIPGSNFTTTNGMIFYDFGVAPTPISGSDYYYTVYVDIDGPRRNSRTTESSTGKKDVDVLKFLIKTDGTIVPDPNSIAANDTDYLSASVRYKTGSTYTYVLTGVTYRRAICAANTSIASGMSTPAYCEPQTTYTNDYNPRPADVSICATQTCEMVLDKPGILDITRYQELIQK